MIKAPKLPDIFAKIRQLSAREKIVFYGTLIVVSLALVDRLIIGTFSGINADLDKRIQNKEAQIRAGLRVTSQEKRISTQSANFRSYLNNAASENEEFTGILKAIDSLAPVQPGFNLMEVKPAGVKQAAQAKKYLVTLNCEGTMEKIGEFMYNIETANKLFVVEKYELTPKSRDTNLAKCAMTISNLVLP
jgi:hypothetical protein